MPVRRLRLTAQGQVQGVGFRPFVFTLAKKHGLTGFVRNTPQGVVIETQGESDHVDAFVCDFHSSLPPLARLTSLIQEEIPPVATKIHDSQNDQADDADQIENAFTIAESTAGAEHAVLISPDMAPCDDCLRDMQQGRRAKYPFTNCTNCGPRYTITRSIPYDRASTSMACFPLCPECAAEYVNPENRRFHAQPNACPVCGPAVWLVESPQHSKAPNDFISGNSLAETSSPTIASPAITSPDTAQPDNPLPDNFLPNSFLPDAKSSPSADDPSQTPLPQATSLQTSASIAQRTAMPPDASQKNDLVFTRLAQSLLNGKIAAIKGLGGFHLACDASDEQAVCLLRERKSRPHKPFAVMTDSVEEARRVAHINSEAERLLLSPERPIVVCPARLQDVPAPAQDSTTEPTSASTQTPTHPLVPTSAQNAVPLTPARDVPQQCTEALAPPLSPHAPSLAPSLAPDSGSIGIMLPSTPLHHVLFSFLRKEAKNSNREQPLVLVMTSGNPGGEPICLGNREALAKLGHMADLFLLHNRDILIRVDDSVVRSLPSGKTLFLRRARGYVPSPVSLPGMPLADLGDLAEEELKRSAASSDSEGDFCGEALPLHTSPAGSNCSLHPQIENKRHNSSPICRVQGLPCVFGAGAELKGTLCFSKGQDAFVSQHIGDMANLETTAFYESTCAHLAELLRVQPEAAVRDLHPDFFSSRFAESYAQTHSIPLFVLQHHAAHAYAVLGEHGIRGKALVLALDGTGLGDDGTLWGGESILVDMAKGEHARVGTLAPMALPGGEAAIREPWRIAHALLLRMGITPDAGAKLPWLPEYSQAAHILPAMVERKINTPESTSCGRLFDAAAALLGLCNATSFEGQAAIRLEEAQRWALPFEPDRVLAEYAVYPAPVNEIPGPDGASTMLQLDTQTLFRALYDDLEQTNKSVSEKSTDCAKMDANFPETSASLPKNDIRILARRFHASLAQGLADCAAKLANLHGVADVGLSGGCLNNGTLAELLVYALEKRGLRPLLHKALPPGDGCISYGQVVYGRLRLAQ